MKGNNRESQVRLVLKHLRKRKGRKLCQSDALFFYKIPRLASRINDLKKQGHKIGKITDVNKFAHYYLIIE
jgi:hypothetical protein